MALRAEERAGLEASLLNVFVDRLAGGVVKPDRAALAALFVQLDSGLVPVLMKVRNLEPAAGAEPRSGIDEEFEDGPVPVINRWFPRPIFQSPSGFYEER